MKIKICLLIFALILQLEKSVYAQHKFLGSWPPASNPTVIGKKLSQRFLQTPHTNFAFSSPPSSITYSEVCAWYGALKFAKQTADKFLIEKLEERFRPLLYEKKNLQPRPDHVDPNVFGTIPLELSMQQPNDIYRSMGLWFANQQWASPQKPTNTQTALVEKGLSWQTRFWIDDMYMITNLQAQAYRASKDSKYIDRAALEMTSYLDSLQRPNGLFYHAPDAPFFWGRGNGWMAAGMAELLSVLPKDHPRRQKILTAYRKMMSTLKRFQANEGLWRQLVDDEHSWIETSGSAMFTFAFIKGVKNGWLEENTYGPVARKAWLALLGYIDENGDVREVCQGTNKGDTKLYYLNRSRITGDMHGQAPLLWCSFALMEKEGKE